LTTILKNLTQNKNIGEQSIFNFSTNYFWGGGREIAQEGDETLPKVSPKLSATFCELNISPKLHYAPLC